MNASFASAFAALQAGGVGVLCEQWAFWVVSVLVQSTVLLSVGFLAVRLARSQGPAMQSAIMRVVLAAVFLSPLVTGLTGAAGLNKGLLDSVLTPPGRPEPVAAVPELSPALAPRHEILRIEARPASAAPESRGSVLYIVLASAALVTTAVLLLRIAGACIWMRRMRLDATPAPHAVQKACSGLASKLRVPAPTVLVSGEVNSPCLVGILNPAVVLPEVSMTSSQLRYVLYHELAHLARRDGLWNLAGRVMRALLFFQPLIYAFTSKMEWMNDEIADDYVVLMGGGGADYAEQLTSVAEMPEGPVLVGVRRRYGVQLLAGPPGAAHPGFGPAYGALRGPARRRRHSGCGTRNGGGHGSSFRHGRRTAKRHADCNAFRRGSLPPGQVASR